MDWLWQLFDTAGFTPRGGPAWEPWMVGASRIAHILTFTAFVWIPASLFTLWDTRRHDRKETWVILLFAAFIFACGVGHLCDFVSFYWPAYRLFLVADILTAVIAVPTALILPQIVARLKDLPGHNELQHANEALATLLARNRVLERELAEARRPA